MIEIGTRQIESCTGVFWIDLQHPLKGDDGFVGFSAIERRDAEQIIEFDIAGQLILLRDKDHVSLLGIARREQLLGIAEQRRIGNDSCGP